MGALSALETERRFLVEMPNREALLSLPGAESSRIVQTYLASSLGVTERVRRREWESGVAYTHTAKHRVTAATAYEDERRIDKDEYERLLLRADRALRTIEKERITIPYGPHLLEIDLYPFWQHTALLEVELPCEDAALSLPPYLHILTEITEDGRYRNAAMARELPPERP